MQPYETGLPQLLCKAPHLLPHHPASAVFHRMETYGRLLPF